MAANRCSTHVPDYLAGYPGRCGHPADDSPSWLSRAKATRTISPFQQVNSSASERQRSLERLVMIVPSWVLGKRRTVCRASNKPLFFISR